MLVRYVFAETTKILSSCDSAQNFVMLSENIFNL